MSFERDFAALQQMTAELKDYLLSDVAFWPLGGSSNFPRLSLGRYLLTRARLAADAGHAAQVAQVAELGRQADQVLAQWPAVAERKAEQEIHTRLHLWETYLAERQGRYATEVAQRAMLALLLRRFPALAETAASQRLAALDTALKARLRPGAFIWETGLEAAFPEKEYWFLYGVP